MSSLENVVANWPMGAVVVVGRGDAALFRPAAFVFDTPDGFAWVEPSYADPAGASSPGFHRRTAADLESGEVQVLPYRAGDRDLVGDALDWFARWLEAEGRTWAEERERVRALVGNELT